MEADTRADVHDSGSERGFLIKFSGGMKRFSTGAVPRTYRIST